MNHNIHYFDKDIWVTDSIFHCNSYDIELKDIKDIYINFKVNRALAGFLSFIGCFACLFVTYAKFGDVGYFWLIPLTLTFGWMRYTLLNYVEVIVETDAARTVLVTSMRKRSWAYEIEDYVKHSLSGKKLTEKKVADSC